MRLLAGLIPKDKGQLAKISKMKINIASGWGRNKTNQRQIGQKSSATQGLLGSPLASYLGNYLDKTQAHSMGQAKTFIKSQFMKHG